MISHYRTSEWPVLITTHTAVTHNLALRVVVAYENVIIKDKVLVGVLAVDDSGHCKWRDTISGEY